MNFFKKAKEQFSKGGIDIELILENNNISLNDDVINAQITISAQEAKIVDDISVIIELERQYAKQPNQTTQKANDHFVLAEIHSNQIELKAQETKNFKIVLPLMGLKEFLNKKQIVPNSILNNLITNHDYVDRYGVLATAKLEGHRDPKDFKTINVVENPNQNYGFNTQIRF